MTKKLQRFLGILGFSTEVMASAVGNPASPSVLEEGFFISDQNWSCVKCGITGDLLLNKRLTECEESEKLDIKHAELSWKLAVCDLGWTIGERLDVHLLVGPVSQSRVSWQQGATRYNALGNQGLFWGSSAGLVLLDILDTTLGLEAQGGGISWIEGTLSQNATPTQTGFTASMHFWQVGLGVSQNLGLLRPYIGGACSHLFYIVHSPNVRLQDLLAYGTFEGCSISFGSRFLLNIEARQFFESGLSISGELRF